MVEINHILDLATDHFMKLGIKSVSMDDLASHFGISKKTLYQQFKNKKDLVNQSISRHVNLEQALINEISASANDAIDEMVQLSEHMVISFRQIKPTLIHDLQKYYRDIWDNVMQYQSSFYSNKIKDNIIRGQKEGYYRNCADADIISKLYVAKSVSLVDEQMFSLVDYPRDHLIQQHIHYHISGILSDKGRVYLKDFELFKN